MRTILATTLVTIGLAGLAIAAARTDPPPTASPASGITILSDVALPASAIWARDVRWASDSSVYVSLAIDGIVEMSLDPAKPTLKEMIPAAAKQAGDVAGLLTVLGFAVAAALSAVS